MKSALQVILTTRNGIIVFIAHVMTLDATAAYPNHMGHSVCLKNSISFPCLDRCPPRHNAGHMDYGASETLLIQRRPIRINVTPHSGGD
jgi:hypothetical protein